MMILQTPHPQTPTSRPPTIAAHTAGGVHPSTPHKCRAASSLTSTLLWAAPGQHKEFSMHMVHPPLRPQPRDLVGPKDPRLTAGTVGPSPAGFTVAGVRGNTAAMHTLLCTQGCRGPREREEAQEQTVKTNHLVKEHKPLRNDPLGPQGCSECITGFGENQATPDPHHLINSEMDPTRVCFTPASFPKRKPKPKKGQS